MMAMISRSALGCRLYHRQLASISQRSTHDYDLLVIGGGSGGLACAKQASLYDKKVAVLDYVSPSPKGSKWGLGGTCVNVGCIPKKLMHQAALLGRAIKDSKSYGWLLDSKPQDDTIISTDNNSISVEHNWSALKDAINNHIRSLNWGYRVQLNQRKIDYFNSYGRFIDQHTIEAVNSAGEKNYLTADNIVIAVGCRPAYPDQVSGAVQYGITSDDLFTLKKPPGKTLVIGASYVALECAGFLQGLGYPTSVMIRSRPLKGFDKQMSELIVQHMEQEEGVNIMRGCVPLALKPLEDDTSLGEHSPLLVQYKCLDDQLVGSDTWNTVIFATGRKPLLSDMSLDAVGINTCSVSGRVIVDDNDSTSIPHVFAIGDIAEGRPELTPVAVKAGKTLSNRLFGGSTKIMNYTNVPTTVFTPLELSCIGLNEEQAIDEHGEDNIEIYHAYYRPLEYYLPDRDASHCYIKVVTVKDAISCSETVLGIHITGPNTGEILQGFAVAMRSDKLTMDDIQNTVGIHPTSAEEMVKLNITKRSGLDPTVTGC